MKTISIRLLLTVMTLLVLAACQRYREDIFFRSYVSTYYSAEEIELIRSKRPEWAKVIVIKPGPLVGIPAKPPYLCDYNSEKYEKMRYDELCRKHNDMSYNRTITMHYIGQSFEYEYKHEYIAEDFVSLRVISDSDFDAEHPAGTDLGDVIRYAYYSPKKYIDSGYTLEYNWGTATGLAGELYSAASSCTHPIDKLVSELTPDDLILLGTYSLGALQFESQPTLSQAHRLTVTMTTDDGKELSASIDMDFGAE